MGKEIVDINNTTKECVYNNEHYSVRDDGAIKRHQREGMRKRKLDDEWSYGTLNAATGYLEFCGERVHRIVATAFHGPAPSKQHVVDHIDTNRQNNRPENLRWLTRLENILNNEITRKKVELICGSVEAFLNKPSLLFGYETEDKNFSWMRRVTPEEAKNCLENWHNWVRSVSPNPNYNKEESKAGDWIYRKSSQPYQPNHTRPKDSNKDDSLAYPSDNEEYFEESGGTVVDTAEWMAKTFGPQEEEKKDDGWNDSFTPSAKQLWITKTEFPCCPLEVSSDGLKQYHENLIEGNVYSKNAYRTNYVITSKINTKKNYLTILSTNRQGEVFGAYSLDIVQIEKGKFCHTHLRGFGDLETATYFFKRVNGEEKWTEEDIEEWDL